jgi:hypothetical protein
VPILLWLGVGWLGLLLLNNKDPRYSAPLLPAVALVTARLLESRQRLMLVLLPFLALQHYLVSFGVRALPEAVVLLRGTEGALPWHWHLYTQSYFGLWGPPAREDWQVDAVLDRVKSGSLGIVPDIPRFDSAAFQLLASLRQLPVTVHRISSVAEAADFEGDFILAGKNVQPTYSSPHNSLVEDFLQMNSSRFRPVESISLPNAETILMYEVVKP